MDLVGVQVEMPTNNPIVLLRERTGPGRILPILIGVPEASAIELALKGEPTPRPMTHDLLVSLLEDLGATLESIVVTELRDRTFYAELRFEAAGRKHELSCRPSDAIAIAARTTMSIFVEERVMEQAGYLEPVDDDPEDADPDDMVEEFRNFIDNVNPDDFAP